MSDELENEIEVGDEVMYYECRVTVRALYGRWAWIHGTGSESGVTTEARYLRPIPKTVMVQLDRLDAEFYAHWRPNAENVHGRLGRAARRALEV